MRYYFAGAYARRAELEVYADEMVSAIKSAYVVSTWLTGPQEGHDAGFSAAGLTNPANVELAWTYARRDLDDLGTADVLVSFTGLGARGGRHVEFGTFLMHADLTAYLGDAPRRMVIVGPREHVFHCHPDVEVFPDWQAFLQHEISNPREDDE